MQKLEEPSAQLQTLCMALSLAVMDQDKVLLIFAFVVFPYLSDFELSS